MLKFHAGLKSNWMNSLKKNCFGLLNPQTTHLSQEMSKLQITGGWKSIMCSVKVSLPMAGRTLANVTHHFSECHNQKAFNKIIRQGL